MSFMSLIKQRSVELFMVSLFHSNLQFVYLYANITLIFLYLYIRPEVSVTYPHTFSYQITSYILRPLHFHRYSRIQEVNSFLFYWICTAFSIQKNIFVVKQNIYYRNIFHNINIPLFSLLQYYSCLLFPFLKKDLLGCLGG